MWDAASLQTLFKPLSSSSIGGVVQVCFLTGTMNTHKIAFEEVHQRNESSLALITIDFLHNRLPLFTVGESHDITINIDKQ